MILLAFAESSIQLVPDGTLFLHIAIIFLMIFVLNSLLFKPINSVLDRRARDTKGRSGEAQSTLKDVERSLSEYESRLREARARGYALMEQQRAAALSERQRQVAAIRQEVERSVGEEKRSIAAQTEEARRNLDQDARRAAAEISRRVLGRPVSNLTASDSSARV